MPFPEFSPSLDCAGARRLEGYRAPRRGEEDARGDRIQRCVGRGHNRVPNHPPTRGNGRAGKGERYSSMFKGLGFCFSFERRKRMKN